MAKSKQRAPSASPRGKSVQSSPSEIPAADTEEQPQQDDASQRSNASPIKEEQQHHEEHSHVNEEEDAVNSSSVVVLDLACPLCVAKTITQPVVLHGFKDEKDGQHHVCLACEDCAKRWLETAIDDVNANTNRNNFAVACPRCSHETDLEKTSD
ncbi:Hypothetical protein, putative, partial [Bodo saltans]